jgi:hypothetical protein
VPAARCHLSRHEPKQAAETTGIRPIEPAACLVIGQPTVPPFFSQAFADLVGRNPWPLQAFWPLHALFAVLQALWPLQALIPIQWTLAFLAEEGVTDTPFIASAIAAMARLVPETILYFMLISLGNRSRSERQMGLQASPQSLYVSKVQQFTLITQLLPWRRPRETTSGVRNKASRAPA